MGRARSVDNKSWVQSCDRVHNDRHLHRLALITIGKQYESRACNKLASLHIIRLRVEEDYLNKWNQGSPVEEKLNITIFISVDSMKTFVKLQQDILSPYLRENKQVFWWFCCFSVIGRNDESGLKEIKKVIPSDLVNTALVSRCMLGRIYEERTSEIRGDFQTNSESNRRNDT